MKQVVTISRYLLAVVFIFSGFVKGIDPMGSAYKFHDYFMAFHLNFMQPLTLVFAFILCAAELLIGLMLLYGVNLRIAAWGVFIFMLAFTPLTLILAIFNPVSDCGCFGDALRLTNWQTFFKNIVLLAAAYTLFRYRASLPPSFSGEMQSAGFIALCVLAFLPPIHGSLHEPMYDFRPFHVGVNIHQAMIYPDGAPADVYKTKLYYQKNGEVKEFDESNYPWQDSTWTFVDSKFILVKKGYTPPISNFSLHSVDGVDLTDSIIQSPGYTFLVVSPQLEKVGVKAQEQVKNIFMGATERGYKFYWATASSGEVMEKIKVKSRVELPFVLGDEVTLKTITRSNPGLILIYNGTIIGKWGWRDIPEQLFKNPDLLAWQLNNHRLMAGNRLTAVFILLLALAFVVLKPWKHSEFEFHGERIKDKG